MAPGWHEAEEAKRIRRLYRRGGMVDRQQIHVTEKTGDFRREQRRTADRRGAEPTPRTIWGGAAGGRRHGHAALSQVHHWLGVDIRLRLVGRPGRIQSD